MEYMFENAPEGIQLPFVNSPDDFELQYGDGTECLYLAVIRYANNTKTTKMQPNKILLNDESKWNVTGVSFGDSDTN